ncbi:MAG: carboxypeptidase-like regulatory domain-containing protein [Natrialbaceae archaeon]|nr:carboxypeptidase-like regulatory domain-containing protein [Natrialbaceae archaeon]
MPTLVKYIAVMATVGSTADPAVTVQSGDINVTDNTTIIGVDAFTVQDGSSAVTAPATVGAGENATFSISSGLEGSAIDHGVVLYNESTLTSSTVNLNLTAPVNENLSVDDLIIEHTIASVEGVQAIEGGVDLFGASPSAHSSTGSQSVADIIAFLANEGNISGVQSDAIDSTSLNASVTAVADRANATNVSVGTLPTWAGGQYRWIHVAANESDVVATETGILTVEQTGTITGTVRDGDGDPLTNASIRLDGNLTTTTNATGGYQVSTVEPGNHTLTASLAGYENATANVTISPGATLEQNFTLTAQNGTIVGTVTDGTGAPLSNATATLASSGATALSVANGSYSIANVSPGNYTLTVSLAGYESATQAVTVPPGGTVVQNVTLVERAIGDLVSVWDRAPLPLRANLSNATTVVDNAQAVLTDDAGNSVDANREQLGVFDPGQIPLSVSTQDVTGPDDTYAGENVTLIVGRTRSSLAQLRNLASIAGFDDETLTELNSDVEFETVTLPQSALDANGEMDNIVYSADPG